MSPIILAMVGVMYVGVAIQYWINGQKGMTLAFIGYALAQVGFIMEVK